MVSGVNLGRPPDNLSKLLELTVPEIIINCSPEKSTNSPDQNIEPSVPGLNPAAPSFSSLLSTSDSCKTNVALSLVQENHLQADCQVSQVCSTAAQWSSGKQVPVRSTIGRLEEPEKSKNESLLPFLPFMDDPDLSALSAPAKPVLRANSLQTTEVKIPNAVFIDRLLPPPDVILPVQPQYPTTYYVALGNAVSAAGVDLAGFTYPACTPNFKGARIPLKHTSLNIERWRHHLIGYENVEIIQFLEYGFPLGLLDKPELESCTRNHGSSYEYYPFIDSFISGEIEKNGLSGPCLEAPWPDMICTPLMSAVKKPSGRRAVFDATFGSHSLNNSTPSEHYMEEPCVYTFPKINDFRMMVLKCGPNSLMFKRDLSRYFLQLPLCPSEYHRVGFVWRCLLFFFVGLMFGLRHSGLQGQRVTDSVSWMHRRQGLESPCGEMFNVCNYSDDFGGVEEDPIQAQRSFIGLGNLLADLGLAESSSKAVAPTTQMPYLGILFDTIKMTMSVPVDKLAELKAEIDEWARKTTISKRNLQSLLGKLFWVCKVVRFSRVFMGRLLAQLRNMSGLKDNVKIKLEEQSRKDLLWWSQFLRKFNGVTIIFNEDAIPLTLEQFLDTPERVCAGDSTPFGIGAWHKDEYWSRKMPVILVGSPIHVLEFWSVIVSARLWGDSWSGKVITIFSDNDPVVDVINLEKPHDPVMLSLLREFIFLVCEKKFVPVLRKIKSQDNYLADHISRRFDPNSAAALFEKHGLKEMKAITAPDHLFKLSAPW